jgi:hypothetical protein
MKKLGLQSTSYLYTLTDKCRAARDLYTSEDKSPLIMIVLLLLKMLLSLSVTFE